MTGGAGTDDAEVHENPVAATTTEALASEAADELQPLLGDGEVSRENYNALLAVVQSLRRELSEAERGGMLESKVKRISQKRPRTGIRPPSSSCASRRRTTTPACARVGRSCLRSAAPWCCSRLSRRWRLP